MKALPDRAAPVLTTEEALARVRASAAYAHELARLDAETAARLRPAHDVSETMPGDLQWKLDTLRPGQCGEVTLKRDEWAYVCAVLAARAGREP